MYIHVNTNSKKSAQRFKHVLFPHIHKYYNKNIYFASFSQFKTQFCQVFAAIIKSYGVYTYKNCQHCPYMYNWSVHLILRVFFKTFTQMMGLCEKKTPDHNRHFGPFRNCPFP